MGYTETIWRVTDKTMPAIGVCNFIRAMLKFCATEDRVYVRDAWF